MDQSRPPEPKGRFTRVEWIVSILILTALISMLVFEIGPFQKVISGTRKTSEINNGRQIMTALKLYAGDHNGEFPTANEDANDALRQLFPEYIDQERIFWNPKSAYCAENPPDEDYGQDPKTDSHSPKALSVGENSWAYVSGLKDSNKATLPILANGFTVNGNQYDQKHYLWNVNRAIVIYLDGSGIPEKIVKIRGHEIGEVRGKGKRKKMNLFAPEALGRGKLFNPARPETFVRKQTDPPANIDSANAIR